MLQYVIHVGANGREDVDPMNIRACKQEISLDLTVDEKRICPSESLQLLGQVFCPRGRRRGLNDNQPSLCQLL